MDNDLVLLTPLLAPIKPWEVNKVSDKALELMQYVNNKLLKSDLNKREYHIIQNQIDKRQSCLEKKVFPDIYNLFEEKLRYDLSGNGSLITDKEDDFQLSPISVLETFVPPPELPLVKPTPKKLKSILKNESNDIKFDNIEIDNTNKKSESDNNIEPVRQSARSFLKQFKKVYNGPDKIKDKEDLNSNSRGNEDDKEKSSRNCINKEVSIINKSITNNLSQNIKPSCSTYGTNNELKLTQNSEVNGFFEMFPNDDDDLDLDIPDITFDPIKTKKPLNIVEGKSDRTYKIQQDKQIDRKHSFEQYLNDDFDELFSVIDDSQCVLESQFFHQKNNEIESLKSTQSKFVEKKQSFGQLLLNDDFDDLMSVIDETQYELQKPLPKTTNGTDICSYQDDWCVSDNLLDSLSRDINTNFIPKSNLPIQNFQAERNIIESETDSSHTTKKRGKITANKYYEMEIVQGKCKVPKVRQTKLTDVFSVNKCISKAPVKDGSNNLKRKVNSKITDFFTSGNEENRSGLSTDSNGCLVGRRKKQKCCTQNISQLSEVDINYNVVLVNEKVAQSLADKIMEASPLEIGFNIIYKEDFCELSRKSTYTGPCTAQGILLGISWSFNLEYSFYYIDLTLSDPCKGSILRSLFLTLFNTNIHCQKLTYRGQNLLKIITKHFAFTKSFNNLQLFDIFVATWMLNPDRPAASFGGSLAVLNHPMRTRVATSEPIFTGCYHLQHLSQAAMKCREKLREMQLWNVFVGIEMKVLPILADMDIRGIKVNKSTLEQMQIKLNECLEIINKKCIEIVGRKIELTKTVQIRKIIYDELQLDKICGVEIRKTDVNKEKSTSKDMLLKLINVHPLPALIIDYKEIQKEKNTYIDANLNYVKNNQIFTTWEQTSTATGRLSSINPNLQSLPKEPFILLKYSRGNNSNTPVELINIRSAFEARDNFTFCATDFQHIEFRIFAHFSQDFSLLSAFRETATIGGDIFAILSKILIGESSSQFNETEQRNRTKKIVYSVMYGVGAKKLSELLNLSFNESILIIESFSERFPGIKRFRWESIAKCKQQGFLASISGRRRYFPDINSSSSEKRAFSERQAVNFLIQGSAADICKSAMILTNDAIQENNLQCKLLLQIHDELVWEIRDDHLEKATSIVKEIIENTDLLCKDFLRLSVPLPISLTTGKNWGNMVKK